MPQVSVIMPAYNSAAFVAEAIESILQQSYRDFEFIIINDGSTDSTGKIIASFTDPRIRYYEHEANHGNNATRAEGLLLANGKYIAIMDSDDISLPNRLQIQVSYLDQHWETEILGGSVEWFGDSVAKIERPPRDPEYIRAALFFKNRIMQPTLMFRKESFDKMHLSWLPEWENMGDYELWYRAKMNGLRIENIRDVLVKYRKSSSQIGSRNLYDRVEKLRKFLSFRLDRMGVKLSTIDEDLLFRFIRTRIEIGPSEFKSLRDIFDKIESANESKKLLPRYSFKAALLFYRLRLGRYYYAINRQNYFGLISYIAVQLIHAGFRSIFLFIRNEI